MSDRLSVISIETEVIPIVGLLAVVEKTPTLFDENPLPEILYLQLVLDVDDDLIGTFALTSYLPIGEPAGITKAGIFVLGAFILPLAVNALQPLSAEKLAKEVDVTDHSQFAAP